MVDSREMTDFLVIVGEGFGGKEFDDEGHVVVLEFKNTT